MNKHTPGPWQIEKQDEDYITIYARSVVIADILDRCADCQAEGRESCVEAQANACLIAAAPELLELLNRLAHAAEVVEGDYHAGVEIQDEDWSELYQAVLGARAAIAKATL